MPSKCFSIGLFAGCLGGLMLSAGGCALAGGETPSQPKLMSVEVESMPEPDPMAPQIEFMEVKAFRGDRDVEPHYSITLRGTLARPAGMADVYGPTAWTAIEVVDAQGRAMQFEADGYGNAAALHNEPVAELYRRLGVSLGRQTGGRVPFSIQLRELDYLTPKLRRLALRSYVLKATGERDVDLELPAVGSDVTLADAWTVTLQDTGSGSQQLLLHAVDADPAVWPLQVDLVDAQGELLSVGYRRGIETIGSTLASRWSFNQEQLAADDGRKLRIRLAEGLGVKQLDTEFGDVELIELKAQPRSAR